MKYTLRYNRYKNREKKFYKLTFNFLYFTLSNFNIQKKRELII